MQKAKAWLVLALLSLYIGSCARDIHSQLRIMPLGDSITLGANYPGAYRVNLERLLETNNINVSFVGSQSNGPDQLKSKNNEGHSGWKIEQISANVVQWLDLAKPDIVLLMIGTNDIATSNVSQIPDVSAALAKLSDLIRLITQYDPKLRLIVSSIPPTVLFWNTYVLQFNEGIQSLIRAQARLGYNIHFADAYSAMGLADLDLYDGVGGAHPSGVGYDKIGNAWYSALINEPSITAASSSR
jgi:lysophospholipase L1-like esterase